MKLAFESGGPLALTVALATACTAEVPVEETAPRTESICCGASCCRIDGECWSAGEDNPSDACEECNPGRSQVAWSTVAGCGGTDGGPAPTPDGGTDGGTEGGPPPTDAGTDAGPGPIADAGVDGGAEDPDGGTAPTDGGLDGGLAPSDAGMPPLADAGVDGGSGAGEDGGPAGDTDAGGDTGSTSGSSGGCSAAGSATSPGAALAWGSIFLLVTRRRLA